MRNWLLALIITFGLGCARPAGPEAVKNFVEDTHNKVRQRIKTGDITVTATLVTPEYNKAINVKRKDVQQPGDDQTTFNIRIEKPDMKPLAHGKMLYATFDMQQDFSILSGADTLRPLICQKIENGLNGSYEYMLAFEKRPYAPGFTLLYEDKLFGTGITAFVYNEADVTKIPAIKIKKDQ